MFGNDITKKIGKALIESSRKFVISNFPDRIFPSDLDVGLQTVRDPRHGDLSCSIGMRLASLLKIPPNDIGQGIIDQLKADISQTGLSDHISKIELKGGFINFKLSEHFYRGLLKEIKRSGDRFGRSNYGSGMKVNIEFVSANPTGPLTIAHGRQAAIGAALARILEFNGYDVTREYYLNDIGNQIRLLGESLKARYKELIGEPLVMPEDGYMGGYVSDMAQDLLEMREKGSVKDRGIDEQFFKKFAVEYILNLIRRDLEDFSVEFDVWTTQSSIEGRGEVEKTLEDLEQLGYIYRMDGARWFRSSDFGDDKDRVVVKSDGTYTYLAPDMAYHRDKYRRGFDRIIDLLGPDHHGYINRMKAAVQALGFSKRSLDIMIVQLVTLMRSGETVSMSTRKGEFISLRELLDELGPDVTRFFFLSRRLDSHLDLDIELAKEQSKDNPVYYIQYAHARIRSIQKFSEKTPKSSFLGRTPLELLVSDGERQLTRKLSEFPFAVRSAAENLEPNRILSYLNELSGTFHSFYTTCRVVSEDPALSKARLFLVECTRIVLANGLRVLNISMPESM